MAGYMMRLVEQIAKMLASILKLRQEGRDAEAAQEIEAMCLQTVGQTVSQIRRSAPESIAEVLQSSGGLRLQRALLLAEVLRHDAEMSEAAGKTQDALLSYLHAFCLISDSFEVLTAPEQASYRPTLELLASKLEPLKQHPYIRSKLLAHATPTA